MTQQLFTITPATAYPLASVNINKDGPTGSTGFIVTAVFTDINRPAHAKRFADYPSAQTYANGLLTAGVYTEDAVNQLGSINVAP